MSEPIAVTDSGDIVASLGLPYHHKLPSGAQAVVNEAATGRPKALMAYAEMCLELSALNGLTDRETCALVEPVAYLAAVNGGPEAQMFIARLMRRLADALDKEPEPLSRLDEGRRVSSWWQAVAIYEQLARSGHNPAKAELQELIESMAARGIDRAADAGRLLRSAGLIS